ncbi:MAG: large subunit ribosomal protein [Patescibacteria group bacterium]|nr:large subunit ribosomal protein [Patescibacteria group bacterium]
MAKTRAQKEQDLQKLVENLDSAKLAVLADYRGLDVPAISELRNTLRENGVKLVVAKNTLVRKAAAQSAKEITQLEVFTGPMAIAFGTDEVEAAKLMADFAKANKALEIVGGIDEAGEVLTREAVMALAQLPSREQLLAQVVGTVAAPLSGMVRVLNGNLSGLVYALQAIKDKKEAAA